MPEWLSSATVMVRHASFFAIVLITTACEVSRPPLPRPAPVSSPTARVASSGVVGREYAQAVYLCAHDNMDLGSKKLPDGVVSIAFVVRGGRFVDPHLIRASGSPEFDRAALAAVKACDARIATPSELREQLAAEGLELSFYGQKEAYLARSRRDATTVARRRAD